MSVLSNLEKAALDELNAALSRVKILLPLLEGEALNVGKALLNAALPPSLLPIAQMAEAAVTAVEAPSAPAEPATPSA